jgi:hypothetical protein
MLEHTLEMKVKYALAIDYDTFYTQYHILDLYELMEANPDIDAIFPLQPGRASENPMAVNWVDASYQKVNYAKGDFKDYIEPCDSGHFGLTILRMDSVAKMSKPWFECIPDPNKSWNEGAKDADVAFWIKMKKEGLRSALAELYIGHLEETCSFCRPPEDKFKTLHISATDAAQGHMPEWAIPRSMKKEIEAGRITQYRVEDGQV